MPKPPGDGQGPLLQHASAAVAAHKFIANPRAVAVKHHRRNFRAPQPIRALAFVNTSSNDRLPGVTPEADRQGLTTALGVGDARVETSLLRRGQIHLSENALKAFLAHHLRIQGCRDSSQKGEGGRESHGGLRSAKENLRGPNRSSRNHGHVVLPSHHAARPPTCPRRRWRRRGTGPGLGPGPLSGLDRSGSPLATAARKAAP